MTGQSRWKIMAYAVALFVAGGISGALATYHRVETQSLKLNRKREIADHLRERMKTSLVLTPEQEQKFEPVIQATASEMEASHGACLNRISTALDKMQESIKPDLTQEQQVKLKQLQADRRDLMWKKYSYSPGATEPGAH